jgi:kynurenine formamidase
MENPSPTRDEVVAFLRERRNWGRWGDEDQLGALNLITPEKKQSAAKLVTSGESVSLSRPVPLVPALDNPKPAQKYSYWIDIPFGEDVLEPGGAALDYLGVDYHGYSTTHLDALGHNWDAAGMWNGRDPKAEVTPLGLTWGDVDQMRDGIVTRGVLLDVPRARGTDYVTPQEPVHGSELARIAAEQGAELTPGDALVVYMGHERWVADHPEWSVFRDGSPGLHASCLPFLRDNDVAVLAWDFADATPTGYDVPWTVHGALFAYGVVLVDNCDLSRLAAACARLRRVDFLFTVAPLRVPGASGSPVNPIAVL